MAIEVGRAPVLGRLGLSASALSASALSALSASVGPDRGGCCRASAPPVVWSVSAAFGLASAPQTTTGPETTAKSIAAAGKNVSWPVFQSIRYSRVDCYEGCEYPIITSSPLYYDQIGYTITIL